jgi:hypothetical protein
MPDPHLKDKVEEESPKDIKKTPEYRKFKRMLRQVVKAPPLRKASN